MGSRALRATVSLIPPPNLLPRPQRISPPVGDPRLRRLGPRNPHYSSSLSQGRDTLLSSFLSGRCLLPSTLATSLQLPPSAEQVHFCTFRTRIHTPSPSASQLLAHDWSPSTVNVEAIRPPVCRVPSSPVDRIDRLQTPAPSSSEIRITALLEQQAHTGLQLLLQPPQKVTLARSPIPTPSALWDW